MANPLHPAQVTLDRFSDKNGHPYIHAIRLRKVSIDDFAYPLLPTFHIPIRIPEITVLSWLPVGRFLPLGLKATLRTPPKCALRGSPRGC
jgi:hypothetical protein